MQTGLSQEPAMQKLRITRPPLTGEQINTYLVEVWEREKITTFKDFLRRYNNQDVVPTLEAMQNMIGFYHSNGIAKVGLYSTKISNHLLTKVYPCQNLSLYSD